VSTASCSLRDFRSKIINDPISSQELARLVITAVNNKRDVADVYSSIPEIQRDGVSYSYFIQYIDILSSISEENGEIKAFRMLSDDEVYEVTEHQEDSYYGQLIGVEFLYDEENTTPCYLILSNDSNGMTYLSEEWITDSINMYNYGEHYFQMLENEKLEGIFTLLRPGLDEEIFSDTAVYNMAQEYIDYYHLRVRSPRSQYKILTLIPDHLEIKIPETVNSDGSRVLPHNVNVYFRDGAYDIVDQLPNDPDISLLNVSDGNNIDITCGDDYSSSEISRMLGDTSGHVFFYSDSGLLSINYRGMVLIFDTYEYESDDSWSGQLTTIRLVSSNSCTVGQEIFVGMDKTQLFEIYPFISQDDTGTDNDENDTESEEADDLVIELSESSDKYNVEIQFDQTDRISMIRVVKA